MNKNIIKWSLCGISGLLAVMGLCFAWKCPIDCVYGQNSGVFFFKKQLLWNVIGIGMCFVATKIPWQKWLKIAPWTMLVWFGLMVWAVFFSPIHHGSLRWADLGFMCVNVRILFVLVWALFTAWLCSKKCIKPWMVFAIVGIFIILVGVQIFGNANRMARFCAFFGMEDGNSRFKYMQCQMGAAYAVANWFGDANLSLRYLPVAYADAMPSAATLLFGKLFTLTIVGLFTAFGGLLTWVWFAFKNHSKRMFVFFWGGAMTFGAMYSFFQSVCLVPVFGLSPALAGYGGALTVIFWLGLGVVLAIISDEEGVAKVSRAKTIASCVVWIAVFALFFIGAMTVSNSKLKFGTPFPKSRTVSEFGSCANDFISCAKIEYSRL